MEETGMCNDTTAEPAETPDLAGLPIVPLKHLIGFLDSGSRKTCRLVSQKLKKCVDCVGLSVRIDTRQLENTNFCNNGVNIAEARVAHMKTLEFGQNNLGNWKIAILSGLINSDCFINGLQRNCVNLRILILSGNSLVSQDFGEPITGLPIFDHLTQTHFVLGKIAFASAANKANQVVHMSLTKILKRMDSRLHKNMTYLLRTVRSRVLKVVNASILLDPNFVNKRKIYWDQEPLFEFLQFHSNTLEEINMLNIVSEEPDMDMHDYTKPSKLKSLFLTINATVLTYWKDVLLNQQSLQNLILRIDLESCPESLFFQMVLNSVISCNSRTLVRIRLTFSFRCDLNMKIFTKCESLEYIVIEATEYMSILDLNQLPLKNLSILKLLGEVHIGSDFDGVQFLQNCHPRFLHFQGISNEGPFADPRYMLKFAKCALRSRKLNGLYMMMDRKGLRNSGPVFSMNPLALLKMIAVSAFEKLSNPNAPYFKVLIMCDVHDLPDKTRGEFIRNEGRKEYVELASCVDLDYLDVIEDSWEEKFPDPPLPLPRNADSFTLWKNQKTRSIKLEANYQSYSMRVNDLSRVKVLLDEVGLAYK